VLHHDFTEGFDHGGTPASHPFHSSCRTDRGKYKAGGILLPECFWVQSDCLF
jgi:hypothetical protein